MATDIRGKTAGQRGRAKDQVRNFRTSHAAVGQIKPERIAELQAGRDSTRESTPAELVVAGLRALGKAKSVRYDVKAVLPAEQVDGRL